MTALEERQEHLREAVDRDVTELKEAVGDLTTALQDELTLRRRIVAHPRAWMLGAFVLGAWLGRRYV